MGRAAGADVFVQCLTVRTAHAAPSRNVLPTWTLAPVIDKQEVTAVRAGILVAALETTLSALHTAPIVRLIIACIAHTIAID